MDRNAWTGVLSAVILAVFLAWTPTGVAAAGDSVREPVMTEMRVGQEHGEQETSLEGAGTLGDYVGETVILKGLVREEDGEITVQILEYERAEDPTAGDEALGLSTEWPGEDEWWFQY